MKIISMTCPSCGASIQVDSDKKNSNCSYCGNPLFTDYNNSEEAINNTKDIGTSNPNAQFGRAEQPKKRKTWLWVLGWLFVFPVPLTMLVVRSKKLSKPIKITIIAVGIILYMLIAFIGNSSSDSNDVSSEGATNNIKEFSIYKDEFEVVEGESTTASSINVKVKDRDSFSPEDVVFKSDNENVATIRYERDAMTTTLYYVIDGVAPGETEVYATSKDGTIESEHIKVVVKDDGLIDPESIELQTEKTVLGLGGTTYISIITTPENASVKNVNWSSSDENVITIDENGCATAVAAGSATITATVQGNIQNSCDLSVDENMRAMKVNVQRSRLSSNNIGSDWSYSDQIDGESVSGTKEISVGDTITFYSKYVESDENPDVGQGSATHIVTAEDLQNGFSETIDFYVTENGGKNSGQSVHFSVAYNFTIE